MMGIFYDIYWVFWREMKKFFKHRIRIATSLLQPFIWLVLMGSAMAGFTRSPEALQLIGTDNYLQFMAPGIMIMTALFGGVYGGTSVVWDRRLGFLNKLLAAPINRAAIPLGKLAAIVCQSGLQVLAIIIIAMLMGVKVAGGFGGVIWLLAFASLFGTIMGGISLSLASVIKTMESLFAVMNFLTMPIMFTSNAIFPVAAMPLWLQMIARINPLTYAVGPMRSLMLDGFSVEAVLPGFSALLLLATLSAALSIRLFNRSFG